ncbi:MAG: hydrogenase, partial [Acidimicrobiales bacterium]
MPSTYSGTTDLLTLLVLLTEFAMLRAPLLRSQIRLYAFQSLVVTVLAIVVAASRHVPDLYALAAVTFVLKVVLVPGLVLRLMRKADTDLAGSSVLGVAS